MSAALLSSTRRQIVAAFPIVVRGLSTTTRSTSLCPLSLSTITSNVESLVVVQGQQQQQRSLQTSSCGRATLGRTNTALKMTSSSKSSFSTSARGQNIELAKTSLRNADCVCFDVDSTVVDEEGIDVMADFLGKGAEVAALTLQAMEGGMKFQDALKLRLDLLQPSKSQIEACLKQHPLQLTPGVAEFIHKLQAANKHVYLVSGGFRIMIEPVAETLNLPKTRIVANTIVFKDDGSYSHFDPNEPTSRDMGKPKALQSIQAAGKYQCMIMIGDGATDAQAKPPAAAFIGFGGVAVREKVVQVADWFVTDFQDLINVLDEATETSK